MDDRHTEKNIHQGGFPRAILPDQRVDLAFPYVHRDVLQDGVPRIFFANILHAKNDIRQSDGPPFLFVKVVIAESGKLTNLHRDENKKLFQKQRAKPRFLYKLLKIKGVSDDVEHPLNFTTSNH
jgi:hypothetical protein